MTRRVSRVLLFFRGCQLPAQFASRCSRVEMAGNSRPRMSLPESVGRVVCYQHRGNTAAKRLRMRQVKHFRSHFQSHFPVKVSHAHLASFCVQLVVQLFCFMLLVFLTIL